jgi:hypothetical protein
MKVLRNTGADRVIDVIRPWITLGNRLDVVSPTFSLFAFAEVLRDLSKLSKARLVLPSNGRDLALLGTATDRGARNKLQSRWLARQCATWLEQKAELRESRDAVPQGAIVLRDHDGSPQQAVLGAFSFSTEGFGITPGNPLSLIQASETPEESALLSQWFDTQWAGLTINFNSRPAVLEELNRLAEQHDPVQTYALILLHLFRERGEELDEDQSSNPPLAFAIQSSGRSCLSSSMTALLAHSIS